MNTVQDRQHAPPMKASDADRDEVVASLSEHFQAGRLTSDELEERTGQALTARTLDQLDVLTADLPATGTPLQGPVQGQQPTGQPTLVQHWNRLPIAAALAIVVIVAAGLGASQGRHGWDVWWLIPLALIAARRIAGRHRPGRDDQRF